MRRKLELKCQNLDQITSSSFSSSSSTSSSPTSKMSLSSTNAKSKEPGNEQNDISEIMHSNLEDLSPKQHFSKLISPLSDCDQKLLRDKISNSTSATTTAKMPHNTDKCTSDEFVENATGSLPKSSNFESNGNSTDIGSLTNMIKLECDMENSIRRQSISARYLLKTQMQIQKQQQLSNDNTEMLEEQAKKIESGSTSSTSASPEKNLNSGFLNANNMSTMQMAVDLIKMKKKSMLLASAITSATTSNSSNSSNAAFSPSPPPSLPQQTLTPTNLSLHSQPVYSQHTESSLNKTKARLDSSTNRLLDMHAKLNQLALTHQQQVSLKRSPSMNSIAANALITTPSTSNNNEETPANDTISHDATAQDTTVSTSSPKANMPVSSGLVSAAKAASHLIKQASLNPNLESSSPPSFSNASSNLKKAISMSTLYNNNTANASGVLPSSAQPSIVKNGIQAFTQKQISPWNLSTTSTNSNTINNTNSNLTISNHLGTNLLPPKTVRQIKQRSAERQLTSTSILSSVNAATFTSSRGSII
jgi:hypothetical protein